MARRCSAAVVVTNALRRNVAVQQARRVAGSLVRLRQLETKIATLADPDSEALKRHAKVTTGISEFENTLEKLILSADDIPSYGSATARAIRKRLVKNANDRLQHFDQQIVALEAARAEQPLFQAVTSKEDIKSDTDDGVISVSEGDDELSQTSLPASPSSEVVESFVQVMSQVGLENDNDNNQEQEATITAGEDAINNISGSTHRHQSVELSSQSCELPLGAPVTLASADEAGQDKGFSHNHSDFKSNGDLTFSDSEKKNNTPDDEHSDYGSSNSMELVDNLTEHQTPDEHTMAIDVTEAETEFRSLVMKFAADLNRIQLNKEQPVAVRKTVCDLQAAINKVVPTINIDHSQ